MPVRGFLIVLVILLAAGTGVYLMRGGVIHLNRATVSGDITAAERALAGTAPVMHRAPSFDVVKLGPSGEGAVAGHAAPGATVSLLAGSKSVGDATADGQGGWAVVLERPLAHGAQAFTAVAKRGDGAPLESDETIIALISGADRTPLVIAERPDQPSRILQQPNEASGGALEVRIIDYAGDGVTFVTGRAAPRAAVRLYLDNEPCGHARADNKGIWTLKSKQIAPGAYTLRVDELGPKGGVTRRIETPIDRANAGLAADQLLGKSTLGVRIKNAQWHIARRLPGAGTQYAVVYQANQAVARDPKLVYPGQIFQEPEESQEE